MSRPVHRDEARRVGYGIATLAAFVAIGAVGAVAQSNGPLPGVRYTYVTAQFDDVGIMRPGKPVRIDGVGVGIVSQVELHEGRAQVKLRLSGRHDVYRNATARVGNVSALGKRFIALDPGTSDAGRMGEDEVISSARTEDDQSLESILQVLDPKTRSALQASLSELSTGLAGHGDDLNAALAASPELVEDLDTVARALTTADADLPGALRSANVLVGRFAGREQQIAALTANLEQTSRSLNVDGTRPLARTVEKLPDTLVQTRTALDELQTPLADARVALHTLRPGARALGRSTPALRSVLRKAPGPLDKVPAVGRMADPALQGLTRAVHDARPLVSPLSRTVASLDTLLYPLAPYAGDTGQFFAQHDLLSGTLNGTDDKHYFAALLTGPGLFSVGGAPDPLYRQEAYPVPGTPRNPGLTDSRKGGAR